MSDPAPARSASRTLVLGLTGGIAAGKSAVSERLRAAGVPIIDADQIAREVVLPGTSGLRAVTEAFGPRFLTDSGALDRKALGQLVFADRAALRRLEAILHPRIRQVIRQRLDTSRAAGQPVVVVDAALLVEMGMDALCDRVVVVDVPEAVQVERMMRRDGLAEPQARQRLAAQTARADRLARADDVIDNTGSLDELHRQVDDLLGRWRSATERGAPQVPSEEAAR